MRRPALCAALVLVATACGSAPGPNLAEPVGLTTTHETEIVPAAPAAPTPLMHETAECRFYLGAISFGERSSTVSAAEDEKLQRMSRCLTSGPLAAADVLALGHTDVVGTAASDALLGLERAAKVKRFLVAHGVDARRVVAASSGERSGDDAIATARVDVLTMPALPPRSPR